MDAHCFLSPSSTNTDESRAHSAVEKLGKIHAIGVYSTLYIFIKGWFDYQVAKHACLSNHVGEVICSIAVPFLTYAQLGR